MESLMTLHSDEPPAKAKAPGGWRRNAEPDRNLRQRGVPVVSPRVTYGRRCEMTAQPGNRAGPERPASDARA
jgi:hypothetical protein